MTRHLINILTSLAAALALTGCVTENFPECPNEYGLKIVFDRNMLYADAFATQVKSVDIKVFDSETGQQVYAFSESGDALSAAGYTVKLLLAPGTYDILCWGGMAEGNSFGYANPAADMLQENAVVMEINDATSRNRLNDLYHGLLRRHVFVDNNDIGSTDPQTATVYLTKDTNRINVMLHNLDGTEMNESDFEISISSRNAAMAYDNSLMADAAVTYRPWHISPVEAETAETADGNPSRVTTQTALFAEFSTARLMADAASRLDVYRTSDGERIISVPLERNLLLYKGQFYSFMTDQEYLDRQDDYTITFILDSNNNWNRAAMIYINNWSTPPVQYQEW